MNRYLVPANTKKSMLLFGILRPFPDAIIAISGVIVTVVSVAIIGTGTTGQMLLACLPALICLSLVFPLPYYHNTLVAIQSIIRYFSERRNYIWKGWCVQDEFKDTK